MLPKIVEPCFAWQLPYGLQGIGPYRGIHQICRGPIGYLFFPVARFFSLTVPSPTVCWRIFPEFVAYIPMVGTKIPPWSLGKTQSRPILAVDNDQFWTCIICTLLGSASDNHSIVDIWFQDATPWNSWNSQLWIEFSWKKHLLQVEDFNPTTFIDNSKGFMIQSTRWGFSWVFIPFCWFNL